MMGMIAQWLEHQLHNWKAAGTSPGRVIPKTLKMISTAFSSGTQCMKMEWES